MYVLVPIRKVISKEGCRKLFETGFMDVYRAHLVKEKQVGMELLEGPKVSAFRPIRETGKPWQEWAGGKISSIATEADGSRGGFWIFQDLDFAA